MVSDSCEGSLPHVAIVGGRACGTAALIHLVARLPEGASISVIDPEDGCYPAVFDDPDSRLIANSSAEINTLFPDVPDDFLEFIDWFPRGSGVPRSLVGAYYRSRGAEARVRARRAGIQVQHIRSTCTSVVRLSGTPGYQVELADSSSLIATDVVIAVGVDRHRRVDGISGISPFPSSQLQRAAAYRVLIIGQGQSAIDAALVLRAAGSEVVMTSRSGVFPSVRTRTLPHEVNPGPVGCPADVYDLVDHDCRHRGHPPLHRQLVRTSDPVELLRMEAVLAEQDACPWQDSIIGILDLLCERAVPVRKQDGFVWRYVTAIMLSTARQLLAHLDDQSVRVCALSDVKPSGFDLVVLATGFEPPQLRTTSDTLFPGSGAPRTAGRLALDADLRVILSSRRGPERIWAIGPSTSVRVPFANFMRAAVRQATAAATMIGQAHRKGGLS